jgi:nicotinamidase-related amidase
MNTALVLIDIQRDYFPEGRMELVGPVAASENAKLLLDHFRANSLPIIHVRHISKREDASFFRPNTEGIEFDSHVAPSENESVITKHIPNSFRETELDDLLSKLEISKIVFCGMMTHMCIDATVRAASDKKYECVVAHDACATKNLIFNNVEIPSQQVHASFMAALSGAYAKVISSADIIAIMST